MADRNYSPHQQKIIKRYYENYDTIKLQRLNDLATELYLADSAKKQARLWKQVEEILVAMEFPASRIAHLMQSRDPSLIVGITQEMDKKG